MSNLTIEVKNDAMLGRLDESYLHIELIKKDKEIERLNEEVEYYKNIAKGIEKFFEYEKKNDCPPLNSHRWGRICVWDICLDKLKELKENR